MRYAVSKVSMSSCSRTALRKSFNPKPILFGIAVFNFVLIAHQSQYRVGVCFYSSWYSPWSFFNQPTLLLLAAVALLFSRKWTYVIALGLPGYVIGSLFYSLWLYNPSVAQGVVIFVKRFF